MDGSEILATLSTDFINKVRSKSAVIGVIGLGYVGLPLVLGFNEAGFSMIGFDIDQKRVKELNRGISQISHISDADVLNAVKSGRFEATDDFQKIGDVDTIIICVPTPLNKYREPDLSYIETTAKMISPHLRRGQLVVLESTTYPGTTNEVLIPLLEADSGLKSDQDFVVAFSPEREDPANPRYNTRNIPKIVGANSAEGIKMASEVYSSFIDNVVPVSDCSTAEAVKLTENIFRAVNIALVNELKLIYDDMGIDVWEVIDAAATKPFGFMPFYPGPGLGGHCVPIDPFYLTWKAREYGLHTRFIELAGEINQNMPQHVVNKLIGFLSKSKQKAVSGAKVLIVGIAYKKNVNDMRESPSFELMDLLREQGAELAYHDPYVPVISKTRKYQAYMGMESVEWSAEELAKHDVVLIATDHDDIDWQLLIDFGSLIIDTRNVLSKWLPEFDHKILKA